MYIKPISSNRLPSPTAGIHQDTSSSLPSFINKARVERPAAGRGCYPLPSKCHRIVTFLRWIPTHTFTCHQGSTEISGRILSARVKKS